MHADAHPDPTAHGDAGAGGHADWHAVRRLRR
jgi:hypothetical protein